ncbi:DUF6311 domain-containing protein [Dyella sp. BiH032]|uniref:DUF6311 domain-containing protein n=1 Tax=Dyella sp. BiH032 TaxID=3075430 RepID=UPI00289310B0|nr:DUF6311 domain-containing protein [Dyella sp. BiH032]WNL45540.1 DUF6311 domain-containing protein [Dyella sp. BiH032]
MNRHSTMCRWLPFVLGGLLVAMLSALWARYVLGPIPFDTSAGGWLWGDLAQVRIAWGQYLSDPDAHWLTTNRLSYPKPMSIALFDPMPLLLLLARPFAGWVGEGHQYFGYYFGLCLLLQGVFGYLATSRAMVLAGGGQSWASRGCAVLAGLLFASVPYTFVRFQGHTALSSQWVLVFAIWVVLSTLDWPWQKWCLANGAVLLVATGINPYFVLMILISDGVLVALLLRQRRYREVLIRLSVLVAVAAAGLMIFGFIAGSTADTGGYGVYSMNLLGPLDSNGRGGLLPLDVADATGGQTFEGFDYVGAGLLALGTVALASGLSRRRSTSRFPFLAALLISTCCAILAMSTHLTVGSYAVDIPVPRAAIFLLSRFRGSGRLFWMAGFWLLLVAVAACVTHFGSRRTVFVLAMTVLAQFVDLRPLAADVRTNIASYSTQRLSGVPDGNYSAILVFPAWQCDTVKTPGGVRNYESIGYFALGHHIPTNNFYAARTPDSQQRFHCNYDARLKQVDSRAAYLLSEELFTQYRDRFAAMQCQRLAGMDAAWSCLPEGGR